MTVEELEIIVTAKVEEAMKEIQKLMPALKKIAKQAQQSMQNIDTEAVKNKISQATNFVQKKIKDLKKSAQNNEIAIKVTNTDAKKQITQLQKEIDSLQKKITGRQMKLDIINPQIDSIVANTRKEVTPDGINPNSRTMDPIVDKALSSNKNFSLLSRQANKLQNEMESYQKALSSALSKMKQLNQETNNTGTSQNRLTKFLNAFKGKIGGANNSFKSLRTGMQGLPKIMQRLPKITQKITNNIKGMENSLKGGFKHVLKYAGALLSIRGVYGLLRGSANAWLSSQNAGAQQLSANINYMKYAMGSMFAPVIQYVTNLMYQLLKAIQSVVYALSGVNIFAKATASSMKSTAGSAKETSKSLAGVHGEINNVSDGKSGGSGGDVSPNMDLSTMDNKMSAMAQKLYDFFKPLKDSWKKYGNIVIDGFKNAFQGIVASAGSMWKSVEQIITNGTVYRITGNLLNTIGEIGKAWSSAWDNDNNGTEIIQSVANMIQNLTKNILDLASSTGFKKFLDGILSALSGIAQFIEPIVIGFGEMAGKLLEIAMSTVGDLLKTVGDALKAIAQNPAAAKVLEAVGKALAIIVGTIVACKVALAALRILTDPTVLIIMAIGAAIGVVIYIIENWGAIWEWLCGVAENVCKSIGDFFAGLWQGISDLFSGIGQWFSDRFNEAVEGIKNAFSSVGQFFAGVWQGICNVFSNVANWFGSVFSKAWQAVKNVFSTGGQIFEGIKDGILNGLKAVVNAIIRGINKVVAIPFNGINWALNAIRGVNIFGLEPFSWIKTINVPQIPQLAKGGVLYDDTIVRAGEYLNARSNPEIVTPQNIMEDTFDRVMNKYNGNSNPVQVTVQYLGKTIYEDTINYINGKTRRTGKDTIVTVGG